MTTSKVKKAHSLIHRPVLLKRVIHYMFTKKKKKKAKSTDLRAEKPRPQSSGKVLKLLKGISVSFFTCIIQLLSHMVALKVKFNAVSSSQYQLYKRHSINGTSYYKLHENI